MGRLLVMVVSLVLAGYGTAAAQIVDIEGRYWFADLDASAKVKSDAAPGTRIDLDSDLGIDGGNLPELRLTIATGLNSKIRFAYTHGDFEGDKTIERGWLIDVLAWVTTPIATRIQGARFEQTKLRVANETLGVAAEAREAWFSAVAAEQSAREQPAADEAQETPEILH